MVLARGTLAEVLGGFGAVIFTTGTFLQGHLDAQFTSGVFSSCRHGSAIGHSVPQLLFGHCMGAVISGVSFGGILDFVVYI